MEKVLRCDCGFEVRAVEGEVLVSLARDHARTVHGMELTAEQVLQLAARVEPRDRGRRPFAPENPRGGRR